MNSLACGVASYVVNALWEIPLIAGAGWVSSWLMRRWGPKPQHVVWVGTLMLCLIAPVLPLFAGLLHLTLLSGGGGAVIRTAIVSGARGSDAASDLFVLPNWMIWSVFGGYVCAVAYFAVRLLWLFWGTRSLVRVSTPARLTANTVELWEQVRRAYAVRSVAILCAESVCGLVTVGAKRPAIVLSSGFAEECAQDDFLSAMGHELAHVERRDYAKNLLYEAASLVAAFHPAIWMVKARIVETREMICDSMVTERLVDRKAYRQSLLRMAGRMMKARTLGIHAVGIFDGKVLEERIMAMKTERRVPGRVVRCGLTGCAVLLLLAGVATGSVFAKQVDAKTTQDSKWGKVYHIDKTIKPPVLTYSVEAKYPKQGTYPKAFQGVCVVGAIVDQHGTLHDVHIVRPLGKGFDANAIKAVEQFKFKPALRFGKPVTVAINVEVNFKYY